MKKHLGMAIGILGGVALLLGAGPAAARTSVGISIGIPLPVYVQPAAPVYVQPAPVYYEQPVYVDPRPVYVQPRPVYYYGGYRHAHHGWNHRGNYDQDRDGIANRYDHDIDGDGVANRWDRSPRNPYHH